MAALCMLYSEVIYIALRISKRLLEFHIMSIQLGFAKNRSIESIPVSKSLFFLKNQQSFLITAVPNYS